MTEIREEKMNEIPNFDRRNEYLAFSEERKTHDLHPSFRLAEWHLFRGDYGGKINNFMKNITEFYRDKSSSTGVQKYSITCHKEKKYGH